MPLRSLLEGSVDPRLLGQTLLNPTTSYKFLLFGALLDSALNAQQDNGSLQISKVDLSAGMLSWAYYPVKFFRLKLGAVDMVEDILNSVDIPHGRCPTRSHLRRHYLDVASADAGSQEFANILRYVLTRFLRPFFSEETYGLRDWEVDKKIEYLSREEFDTAIPIYRIEEDCVVLHPKWVKHFSDNAVVVRDWLLWNWCEHLTARNPGSPSISKKLAPPSTRQLTWQRKYWQNVLSVAEVRCPYSDEIVDGDNFSLDHFIPWSWVAHDQIWNLVPTLPTVNGLKSDRIPDAEEYLAKIIDLQLRGIEINREGPPQFWRRTRDQFLMDLRLNSEADFSSRQIIGDHFRATVLPLMNLAVSMGFEGGWRFKK